MHNLLSYKLTKRSTSKVKLEISRENNLFCSEHGFNTRRPGTKQYLCHIYIF